MSTHSKRKFFLLSLLLVLSFKSILAYNDLDSLKNQFYVKSIINQVNVGYQNLYAGKIIYDPGTFGGVSDASYSEYSQKIDELIAQVILYKEDLDIPMLLLWV